jgi:predicted CXXCH cytochrome family protein
MTRDATPEYVKGDFEDAKYDHLGFRTSMFRRDGEFQMDTMDPNWALMRAKEPQRPMPPPGVRRYQVKRLVGSHWMQECLYQDGVGAYHRLPVLYHIAEKRWIHNHGAFLAPESPDFWAKCRGVVWNETCLFCHNTRPVKNPQRDARGRTISYESSVNELGISCEACHGPGGDHVRLNQDPARRYSIRLTERGDPSIVHPARLPPARRDEICARCHGATVPRPEAWDRVRVNDPFIAGQELSRFNTLFHSEAERDYLLANKPEGPKPIKPASNDGRFWGDGTPLTTALEYNGMAMSACYENGRGKLSCLSCHQGHPHDPNFMLKPGMQSNEACYQCHQEYRAKLTEHTHHPADSSGSLCYNCHMPHQVFSLLATHRSHRIQRLSVADSRGTGKPHACNLCHLDKSLGWTQKELVAWSGGRTQAMTLTEEEAKWSSAVLHLMTSDARTRAIVAGAFAQQSALQASGAEWTGEFLATVLEHERYPAVRYLAHRGMRAAYGDEAVRGYDYLAGPPTRKQQLEQLRRDVFAAPIPAGRSYPYLPLTPQHRLDGAVIQQMLQKRHDPDVTINE